MAETKAPTRSPFVSEVLTTSNPLGAVMSIGRFEWERIVVQCRFPNRSTKLVALVAANRATTTTGKDIFPGVTMLMAHTGLGDRQVRQHLKELERTGLLFLVESGSSYGRGGKGRASNYRLSVPVVIRDWYEDVGRSDLTDMWDLSSEDHRQSAATVSPVDNAEHRQPTAGDVEEHRQSDARTPAVSRQTPAVSRRNTGSPLPPTSSLPPHEVNLHQTNPQASAVTLSDVRENEGANEKNLFDEELPPDPEKKPFEERTYAQQEMELLKRQAEYERTRN